MEKESSGSRQKVYSETLPLPIPEQIHEHKVDDVGQPEPHYSSYNQGVEDSILMYDDCTTEPDFHNRVVDRKK